MTTFQILVLNALTLLIRVVVLNNPHQREYAELWIKAADKLIDEARP